MKGLHEVAVCTGAIAETERYDIVKDMGRGANIKKPLRYCKSRIEGDVHSNTTARTPSKNHPVKSQTRAVQGAKAKKVYVSLLTYLYYTKDHTCKKDPRPAL